jgi:hypothetical protein
MANAADRTELLKGLMTLPVEGLKMICLINGGAAVAVLTYVGNLQTKPSTLTSHLLPRLFPAVESYCFGLASAASALVVAYCVQLAYAVAIDRVPTRSATKRYAVLALIGIGLLLAVVGVGSFIRGSLIAAQALSKPN